MLPLAPNTVTVTRSADDTGDYEDDAASPLTVASGARAALTSPSGGDDVVNGRQEVVDAVLTFPATPVIEHADIVVDDDTDETYRVVWVRRRRGLGLDHQAAGLRAVKGAASG